MANRKVGAVTSTTAVGATLGAAVANVLVELIPALGRVEEASIAVILTAVFGLIAGYFVPPRKEEEIVIDDEPDLEDLPEEDEYELLEEVEEDE